MNDGSLLLGAGVAIAVIGLVLGLAAITGKWPEKVSVFGTEWVIGASDGLGSRQRWLVAGLGLALVIVGVAAVVWHACPDLECVTPTRVPPVSGLTETAAESELERADLVVGERSFVASAMAPGLVVRTEPEAGEEVARDTAVAIALSATPAPTPTPTPRPDCSFTGRDVSGQGEEITLRDAGVVCWSFTASSGDGVMIRMFELHPGGDWLKGTVHDRRGNELHRVERDGQDIFTVPEDGMYEVRFRISPEHRNSEDFVADTTYRASVSVN
jgi:hypothetical protein